VILACVIVTQRQVRVWRDGVSLGSTQLLSLSRINIARSNLGYEFAQRGQFDEAVVQFQDAVRIAPTFLPARKSLALALARRGRIREAAEQYEMAIRFQPTDASLRVDYGLALANAKHQAEAKVQYETALRLQPGLAVAHLRLADLLLQIGQTADAIAEYNRALSLDAASPEAHNNFRCGPGAEWKAARGNRPVLGGSASEARLHCRRNNLTRAGARAR
jgi:Tfp pilus assembly protein PilF